MVNAAAVHIRLVMHGVEREGFAKIIERRLEVAQVKPGQATQIVGLSVLLVNPLPRARPQKRRIRPDARSELDSGSPPRFWPLVGGEQ